MAALARRHARLGRTNSFFLGGGKAMLNALYPTAESLGVEIALRRRGGRLEIEDGSSCRPRSAGRRRQ